MHNNDVPNAPLSQDTLRTLFNRAKPLGHQTPIVLRNGIQLTPSAIGCPHCDCSVTTNQLRAQIVRSPDNKTVRCFMFAFCTDCNHYFASVEGYVARLFSAQLNFLAGDTWNPYSEVQLSFQSFPRALLSLMRSKLSWRQTHTHTSVS